MTVKTLKIILSGLFLLTAGACGVNNADQDNDIMDPNVATISSMNTSTPSAQYPHTKPILIHGAKYEFRIVDGRQGGQFAFDGGKGPATTPKSPQGTAQYQRGQEQQQAQQVPQQQTEQAQKQQTEPSKQQTAAPTTGISATESKVIELTNAERRKNGLPDLQANTSLSGVAREKSNDMQAKQYFSHTSPTYGSPFDMMRDFGISYRSAGENIAQGQPSPEDVVQAWMNSEGHRRNILSGDFTHIGVGHTQQGNYWTQMFIKK